MYKECMVDIETLGVSIDAPVLSIGAVLFNLEDDESFDDLRAPDRIFYAVLGVQAQPDRRYDFSTIEWWMEREAVAREAVFNVMRRVSPNVACDAFSRFVAQSTNLWGNGPEFDNAILRRLFTALGRSFPFPYSSSRDYRTLIDLATRKGFSYPTGAKNNHHALDDAVNQVMHAQKAYRFLGS